jgi:sugar lactone lactonase YvrE
VGCSAALGEGLVWDPTRQRLMWLDIDRQELHCLSLDSGRTGRRRLDLLVTAVAPCRDGGLVAATAGGFAFLRDDGAAEHSITVDHDRARIRMNDGKCDPAGRFWAGSMSLDEQTPDLGALYVLDESRTLTRAIAPVSLSNGLGWSPDGRTMYHIDTMAGRLWQAPFDLDTGRVGPRTPLIDFDGRDGHPDGMTVDSEGTLWVAMWGGWAVRRFSSEGRPLGMLNLPTPQVTSCAFGGADLDQLFITTASCGLTPGDGGTAGAGDLYVHRPGVAGIAAELYRG